ncbi:hypothetical protein BO82DRAFT_123758 [Aspergillus uvarum CBS 121591]|uniref:Uncharacterized protein n=1 Tax=Aspergillus uvarum CBS 121591 TaxID=1448315 RepID=A0A319C3V2_9EURO|nr:hypothetical protein BO82DRAFT_123758 [Aspergillus uvarum CBS 121591]PYH79814.1 hypothetical protein BO82DRAFT_123758 [Aspergillus uvarum CBS 121591]
MSCCIRSCTSRPEQLAVEPLRPPPSPSLFPTPSVRQSRFQLGNPLPPSGRVPGSQATAPLFSGSTLTPESLRPRAVCAGCMINAFRIGRALTMRSISGYPLSRIREVIYVPLLKPSQRNAAEVLKTHFLSLPSVLINPILLERNPQSKKKKSKKAIIIRESA